MDGRRISFSCLLTPENSAGVHLKLLARISRLLKNDAFKNQLMRAETPDDILSAIREEDEEF